MVYGCSYRSDRVRDHQRLLAADRKHDAAWRAVILAHLEQGL